jgi:hypothetical protein
MNNEYELNLGVCGCGEWRIAPGQGDGKVKDFGTVNVRGCG